MTTVHAPTSPIGPGLHRHVPAPEYHAWDLLNASKLKTLASKSPAHVKWEMDHPRKTTDAMRLGQAIHCAVLEPERFPEEFKVGPPRRSKADKEEHERMARAGVTELSQRDWETVLAVRDAVRSHRAVRHILDGDAELSAVWKDEQTGLMCKGRFDDTCTWARCIVDLKSTKDASPQAFSRDVFNLGYHLQAAHYIDGARACGLDVEHFVIVAVEKEPPCPVALYQLDAEAVEAGRKQLVPLKEQYAHCVRTGKWPGRRDDVQILSLPGWAWRQLEGGAA